MAPGAHCTRAGGTERALAHGTVGWGRAGAQPGQNSGHGRIHSGFLRGSWAVVPRAAPCPTSPRLGLAHPSVPHGCHQCWPWLVTEGMEHTPPAPPEGPVDTPQGLWGGQAVPQERGWWLRSWAGCAGGPAEPSCRDVAGMCVGGSRGGGEGGRGSSRGSSSFDKQLPEHFQTVVSQRQARCPRAGTDKPRAQGTGRSPPAHPCCPQPTTLDRRARAAPRGGGHVVGMDGHPQAGLGCWAGDASALLAGAGS